MCIIPKVVDLAQKANASFFVGLAWCQLCGAKLSREPLVSDLKELIAVWQVRRHILMEHEGGLT